MHSTGVAPSNLRRSSSTGWGKRERLLTHITRSSPSSRTNASTLGLEEFSSVNSPRPNTGWRLRISIIRLVKWSSEPACFCCASTLMAW